MILKTISGQLPAFPLEVGPGTPISEVGGESVTTVPPWPQGGQGDAPRVGLFSLILSPMTKKTKF